MPRSVHAAGSAWSLFAALCLVCVSAGAQPITTLEFSFSNPGARSMGFGGAFVALADDATAAFANPAGLVQLVRPEVSIEGRSWSYDTPYTGGGRAAGEPTGIGIDTVSGPLFACSSPAVTGLSFASFAYPSRRWAIALFQHQLANYRFLLETQGLFVPTAQGSQRSTIQTGSWDLDVATRGAALGFKAGDRLSLGAGLTYFDPAARIEGRDYLPDDDSLAAFFGRASFAPERLIQIVHGEISRSDWGWSAGFLWTLGRGWKLGGAFREGPELVIEIDLTSGPGDPRFPPGTVLVRDFVVGFHLPDVAALGLSYRSEGGRWTGAFEWTRVGYSVIMESLGPEINQLGEFIDDADEIHLGGERTFLDSRAVWALRAGVWLDPDHRVRHGSDDPIDVALLPPGDNELHYAAGVGAVFGRFQLDLALDLSRLRDAASLSVIYSF